MTKFYFSILILIFPTFSFGHFFIDYQDVKEKPKEFQRATPDGFELLTGKYYGLIQELGNGSSQPISSFGEDVEISEALTLILPPDWFAYVDEQIELLPQISWDANQRPWTNVIADIGKQYGLRFLVDWDQKLLQIESSHRQKLDAVEQPTLMFDEKSGRQVFIYSQEIAPKGYIILDGEFVPVVIR
jgi:hypothetical protein